ncbi:uncharacterized protein TRIADDRAFT_26823 [Trichoplax adhaerens]|uniref:Uncharacterized protein n=1 Tax=Trichoplax adhaerens TaxID=10228 RepID=B3RZ82_TRIAD|nr:hypothetical protein TRIADDRAFT_26823 [Trichoplax adhaerens]EDV23798.1 hypothetical protein TRIADDRAFT_26823 [Trichoplax adhaerens]|eukprot:XP_002113324.1 hypothetical protein TRIADDRAFT_26823 [Trichoplax adhaerens]
MILSPSSAKSFPYHGYRLPLHIYPNYYAIHLHPKYDQLITHGSMIIVVTCQEKTDFIILHKKQIVISTISISSVNNGNDSIKVIKTVEKSKYNFYYLQLEDYLQPNYQYIIHMKFTSYIRTKILNGFYRSHYKTTNGTTRLANFNTLFESTHARAVFPCFDEPVMKAIFSISITVPNGYSALSNTRLYLTKRLSNQKVFYKFRPSPKMSVYLVALVVSDFKHLEGKTTSNISVRTWANPRLCQHTKYSLNIAIKIIPFYERIYGIAYPLSKMADMVVVPQFADGAMENWGLITYRETSMIYNKLTDALHTKQIVALTVAHEIAHQWFGDLVTMRWWNDVWLNEGFASYMENVGANFVAPELKLMKQFLFTNYAPAQDQDALPTIHPIVTHAATADQIDYLFDDISYLKGGCILRMLESFLGTETFYRGIYHYLSQHKYKTATHQDLWRALQWVCRLLC